MSTRVKGAAPPVILITAKATLAAGAAYLCLTVTQESGNLWRYNLSEQKNSRLAQRQDHRAPITWPRCAGPPRSAQTDTSPAPPNDACWSSSSPTMPVGCVRIEPSCVRRHPTSYFFVSLHDPYRDTCHI